MDSEEINYLSVLNTDNLDTIDINKECIDEIIQINNELGNDIYKKVIVNEN